LDKKVIRVRRGMDARSLSLMDGWMCVCEMEMEMVDIGGKMGGRRVREVKEGWNLTGLGRVVLWLMDV
jgi:hypothetical protein